MSVDSGPDASSAVSGRLPALEGDRVFSSYGSFFRTFTTLGSAVWVFLMGSALPMVGDTRLAIIGFLSGLLASSIICLLGAALPSFRYGIDCIDSSKWFLGVRGALLPLIGLLLSALGWAAVVMAMVARGVASLLAQWSDVDAAVDEQLVVVLAIAMLGLCWLLLRSGFRFVQRVNDFVGPALLAFAAISLALLVWKYGVHHLWNTNVAAVDALTTDRRLSLVYAFEFGLTFQLVAWPYNGGLYRLLKHRRNAVGPFMTSVVVSAGFCSVVAALAAVSTGTADPLVWIVELAGRGAGSVLVCLILLLNTAVLCMLLYFAAISVQQVRSLARIRWSSLVGVMLLPLAAAAFSTNWVLTHIVTLATYGGLMFLGISIIAVVDYYVLRRQSIALEQVFVAGARGQYWFWGGVNWVAIAVVVCGVFAYLQMYDPVTLSAGPGFGYFGAALPILCSSAVLYYVLMRLFVVPGQTGGYDIGARALAEQETPVDVRL